MATSIAVTETVTSIDATGTSTSISITDNTSSVTAYNTALPGATPASTVTVTPYGPVTATNIQAAIEQLADQNFRQAAAPTGATVSEGDTWYDTDDDEFKVYRETSTGVFQWVPIMLGTPPGDSDIVDAGAF